MKLKPSILPAATLLFCNSLSAAFFPPPSSSAGVVEREIEREYESQPIEPRKEIPLLEVDVPEQQLALGRRVIISVESITFQGNTVFSQSELEKIARKYIDSELSMDEIHNLCHEIKSLYVKNGYFLAQVYPPFQKIEDEKLIIQIMEGNLGAIRVVGNKHYKESFIKSYFKRFQGRPINYDQFIRAIMLLNENRDLTAGAVFEKGKETGTVDLLLRVNDKAPFHAYLDYNNYGSHITTLSRVGARVDYGNMAFSGDNLTLVEVVGLPVKDLNFTDIIYTVPLNARGTALSASYLFSDFNVQRFKSLDLKGRSMIASLQVTQALGRSRQLNTDMFVGFDYKNIKNLELGRTSSYDKLRIASAGFDLDYVDPLKGRNLLSTRGYIGIPDILDGSPVYDPDSSRPPAGGRFILFNVDFKRIQQCLKNSYVFLNFSGQFALDKLTIPEQFYIGGIDTVRGFPLAVALGDHGYNANFEFRFPPFFLSNKTVPFLKKKKWKDLVQFVGFIDNGQVFFIGGKARHENGHVSLTSAGLGVRIFDLYRFDANFDIGFPISQKHRSSNSISYFKLSLRLL